MSGSESHQRMVTMLLRNMNVMTAILVLVLGACADVTLANLAAVAALRRI